MAVGKGIGEIEKSLLLGFVGLLPQLGGTAVGFGYRDRTLITEEVGQRHAKGLADDLELIYGWEIMTGVPCGYGGLGDAGFLGDPVDREASVIK